MEMKFRLGKPAMTTDFTSNRARFLSEYRNDVADALRQFQRVNLRAMVA
jgi:hypothetical protein